MRRVYFIKPIGMNGPVKIGVSYSPDSRRKTLESWAPFPLEIVAEIEGDTNIERRFHTRFAGSYVKHEWFNWTPELQDTIDAINAGSFDLDSLPDPVSLPRKARDNSYITESWKYERSVRSRLNGWRDSYTRLAEILGPDRYDPSFDWTLHRDALEALVAEARRPAICDTRSSGVQ